MKTRNRLAFEVAVFFALVFALMTSCNTEACVADTKEPPVFIDCKGCK